MILIMAIALIVVGPEKLPELAKTLGRQIVELKRAANALKDSLQEEEKEEAGKTINPEQPRIAEIPSPSPAAQSGAQGMQEREKIDAEEIPAAPTPPKKDDAAAV